MEVEVIFYHQSIGFYSSRGSDLLEIYRMLWLLVLRKVVHELFWNLYDYIRMWELPAVKYITLTDTTRRDCNGIDIGCLTLSKDNWLWRRHPAILLPKVYHIEYIKWIRRQSELLVFIQFIALWLMVGIICLSIFCFYLGFIWNLCFLFFFIIGWFWD